ncbi:MAG: DUF4175 family protein, partial [Bacteroidota bacterium]
MQTHDYYTELIGKLDAFIRKYYKNLLIRGGIYAFTLLLSGYLLLTAMETVGHFSVSVRTGLFYGFLTSLGYILFRYVFVPLGHLYRIGKVITHEEAARIIGVHFSEVEDKLLNVLQLNQQASESSPDRMDLLTASIRQKSEELKPVPFVSAIRLSENRKYLRWAMIPTMVLATVLVTSPSLITEGTQRLIEHRTYFEEPAPFTFKVLNSSLKAIQQEDFLLLVAVEGKEVPAEAFIEIDGNKFRLEKTELTRFQYSLRNLQGDVRFRFTADGFSSKEYVLEAVPNPVLLGFKVSLNYPPYLNKKNEVLENTGDLVIPAGTRVNWSLTTRNTEMLKLVFSDSTYSLSPTGGGDFSFARRFLKNDNYRVIAGNRFLQSRDSMSYAVTVIPDQYPSISVEQQQDSLSSKRTYFRGVIKDDYGFSGLLFVYRFLKTDDTTGVKKNKVFTEKLSVNRNLNADAFFHYWDLSNVGIAAGDEVEYYFEVSDNDGVSGPKSMRSQSQLFKAPSLREISENTEKSNQSIKDELKSGIDKAKQLQKDVSELSKKLMEKKEAGWEEKKKLEDILRKEEELKKKIEELRQKNAEKNRQEQEYKKVDEDIAKKQDELQALMDKLMTPELEKLMEELRQMMEKVDKDQVQDQLNQMKQDNKDFQKELERTLELFKQLEFEQKFQENIDQLKELAKKQEELSKEGEKKDADAKDLKSKQDSLNKEFDKFRKDMDELEKKNEALQEKNDMENTDSQEQDIQQEMQNSSESLGDNKQNKASKSQKNAAKKMEQMAEKMEKQQQQMKQEQEEEDMNALRALLENLLRLSFDQEKLMKELRSVDINNPQYLKLTQQQRKLKDDARMIEDSLFALSKRVTQIASKVNQEIGAINLNMDEALSDLEERTVAQATTRQQFVMTSVNNLTLLLSDALQQMQQQQAQAQPNASCSKPGKKKPSSVSELRKMQEELNKNMQKMKDMLKQQGGNQKGKQKRDQAMSEQLAKMAAQQEYIRNEFNKLDREDNKDGKKSLGNLNDIQNKMEETEKDIVNQMISEQTLR